MERYRIGLDGDNFAIEGLPADVEKIVSIAQLLPDQAFELSSLSGNRLDLNFAKTCLSLINATDSEGRQALWRAAVVYYCKCFSQTSKHNAANQTASEERTGRKPLSPNKTLKGDAEGQARHAEFISLRNRHLVHDENLFLKALSAAVIASSSKSYKIEKVVCTTIEAESLDQPSFGNLNLLIDRALSWVNSQSDKLCVYITGELEKLPREVLLSQPDLKYQPPELRADVRETTSPELALLSTEP